MQILSPIFLNILIPALIFMPFAVFIASLFRALLVLSGKRRVFTGWVRNKVYVLLLYLTFPGLLLIYAMRRLFLILFRIRIIKSHWMFTYGEPTPTFEVETPRSVIQAFMVLFSVFYIGTIVMLWLFDYGLIFAFPLKIVLLYLAFSVWFNLAITSGDVLIFTEIVKTNPRTAIIELLLLFGAIMFIILYFGGILH